MDMAVKNKYLLGINLKVHIVACKVDFKMTHYELTCPADGIGGYLVGQNFHLN
jgi:hypothetical protein